MEFFREAEPIVYCIERAMWQDKSYDFHSWVKMPESWCKECSSYEVNISFCMLCLCIYMHICTRIYLYITITRNTSHQKWLWAMGTVSYPLLSLHLESRLKPLSIRKPGRCHWISSQSFLESLSKCGKINKIAYNCSWILQNLCGMQTYSQLANMFMIGINIFHIAIMKHEFEYFHKLKVYLIDSSDDLKTCCSHLHGSKSIMADDNRAGKGTKFGAHMVVIKPTRHAEPILHFHQSWGLQWP